MAEKTVTLQITIKCHEKVSETSIERELNGVLNKRRHTPSSLYMYIDGHQCEVGFLQWTDAHVTRSK